MLFLIDKGEVILLLGDFNKGDVNLGDWIIYFNNLFFSLEFIIFELKYSFILNVLVGVLTKLQGLLFLGELNFL